jgi:hypothetical protein
MNKMFRKTVLAALLLAALPAAQAAIQNYSFSGAIDSGAYLGQNFSGSFSFDDAGPFTIDAGDASAKWLSVTSFSMSFLGNYNLTNAISATEVKYVNDSFAGLGYSVDTGALQFSLVAGSSNASDAFLAYDTTAGLSGAGTVIYAAVPEPESYALLLAGLGLMATVARRRIKAA